MIQIYKNISITIWIITKNKMESCYGHIIKIF